MEFAADAAGPDPKEEVFAFLTRAQISNELKREIYAIVQREPDLAHTLSALAFLELPPALYGAVTEPMTAAI